MPTQKQTELINSFLDQVSDENVQLYKEVIEHLLFHKFNPRKTKTKDFGLDFYNSKLKQTIVKIYNDDFRLKFFACKEYSQKFKDSIKTVIEEFDAKYTGCYSCGRCTSELQGYTYTYDDGRKVFRCGRELNTIPDVSMDDLDEIKGMIDTQVGYWESD